MIKPPDLQALVLKFGTYDQITAEAWREYDAAMAAYQRRVRGPKPVVKVKQGY